MQVEIQHRSHGEKQSQQCGFRDEDNAENSKDREALRI
jgi:hypothetical protein